MNDHEIVQHMIDFIEEKEKDAQTDYLKTGSKGKTDVVKMILNELENKTNDENQ